MEYVTNAIGNPTALLIERIFWLCLGLFLGLGIITSVIRGLTAVNKQKESTSPKELEYLAEKEFERKNNINQFK